MNIYPWQLDDWVRLQSMRKRLPNSLLFKGTVGIGKFDLAQTFAQSLLCTQPDEAGFACQQCPSCHWFAQGAHPDFRLLQPDSISLENAETEATKKPSKQISVDQVRSLADFFSMSSHQGAKRVVVIHPAEAMNINAANALLKNLEEPAQDLIFILVSHKPQQLLPTILSRCVIFTPSAPSVESATQWLAQQGVKSPAQALAASGYSPLQAVKSGEQASSEERDKLLHSLHQPHALDVFALAEALQKTEQVLVVQWLQQWCYDLMSMKLTGKLRYHLGEETVIAKLVESVAPLKLAQLQKNFVTAKRESQHTLNPKLFFESLLLTYCQLMQK